jgi:threonine dehydratase
LNKYFAHLFLPTMAEGINVKEPGRLTTKIIKSYVDDVITVTEQEIASSILFMLEREKMLVEGAGAAAVATVLHHHLPFYSASTGIIVSGGNFDIGNLGTCRKTAMDLGKAISF